MGLSLSVKQSFIPFIANQMTAVYDPIFETCPFLTVLKMVN